MSGVIISRQIDLGQTVAASFSTPTLFTIARDLTQMQIEAAVAEADVAKVRIGQPVDFTVDAYGARNFKGTVSQIRLNPTTQQNVVTYTVIVSVANPDGALLPGMTANASFLVSDHKNVLLIPNAALSYKPADYKPAKRQAGDVGTLTVFVLEGSTPEPRRIKHRRVGRRQFDRHRRRPPRRRQCDHRRHRQGRQEGPDPRAAGQRAAEEVSAPPAPRSSPSPTSSRTMSARPAPSARCTACR